MVYASGCQAAAALPRTKTYRLKRVSFGRLKDPFFKNKSIGGYAEAFDPVAAVKYLDSNNEFLRRYRAPGAAQPFSVRGASHQSPSLSRRIFLHRFHATRFAVVLPRAAIRHWPCGCVLTSPRMCDARPR